jgi:IS4 transposase
VSNDQLFMAAAVMGVVMAAMLWMLGEHGDEAAQLLKLGTGKVRTWLD